MYQTLLRVRITWAPFAGRWHRYPTSRFQRSLQQRGDPSACLIPAVRREIPWTRLLVDLTRNFQGLDAVILQEPHPYDATADPRLVGESLDASLVAAHDYVAIVCRFHHEPGEISEVVIPEGTTLPVTKSVRARSWSVQYTCS